MLKPPFKLIAILIVLGFALGTGAIQASETPNTSVTLEKQVVEEGGAQSSVNPSPGDKTLAAVSATGVAVFSIILTGWVLWRAKANGAANNNDASGLRVLDWSLAKALSDTHEIKKYNEYTKQEEVVETVLLASSSRTIAFVGLLVMLTFYVGVACVAIYKFALTGQFPTNLDETLNFLAAGLALFVPYGVNKFSGIMKQPKIAKPIE